MTNISCAEIGIFAALLQDNVAKQQAILTTNTNIANDHRSTQLPK
ncbi:MAG: hypothetical protein ACKO1F_17915 [Flammeovirgaceae bacterium]